MCVVERGMCPAKGCVIPLRVSDHSVFRRKSCFSLMCPCKRTFCMRQNYCSIPGVFFFILLLVRFLWMDSAFQLLFCAFDSSNVCVVEDGCCIWTRISIYLCVVGERSSQDVDEKEWVWSSMPSCICSPRVWFRRCESLLWSVVERVGLGCQLMKRSEVDVGRLLIAHCCKKFASHVSTEPKMPCDPLFVNVRCFAVDVAEHVVYSSVVLWLWVMTLFLCSVSLIHEAPSRDASCAVVRFFFLTFIQIHVRCDPNCWRSGWWDVCREWRFHLTLVFALALVSSQRDGECHQCLLMWFHWSWETQGSSLCVRIVLSAMHVCLHQPLFNDEKDDESDTVWESFSSILCDDDWGICLRNQRVFGHFFLLYTLCAGSLQFLVFSSVWKRFFIWASPTSFLRPTLRSKIVWCVPHVFPSTMVRNIARFVKKSKSRLVRNMCCRCRIFIFSFQACLRSWHVFLGLRGFHRIRTRHYNSTLHDLHFCCESSKFFSGWEMPKSRGSYWVFAFFVHRESVSCCVFLVYRVWVSIRSGCCLMNNRAASVFSSSRFSNIPSIVYFYLRCLERKSGSWIQVRA